VLDLVLVYSCEAGRVLGDKGGVDGILFRVGRGDAVGDVVDCFLGGGVVLVRFQARLDSRLLGGEGLNVCGEMGVEVRVYVELWEVLWGEWLGGEY